MLWRLLYETAGRAEEILSLNVDDLDTEFRRTRVILASTRWCCSPAGYFGSIGTAPMSVVLADSGLDPHVNLETRQCDSSG